MGKKLPYTPNSQIRSALRQLWLRSRERAAAIKRDKYSCQYCGAKQSRVKGREVYVEVHHKNGITNWQVLYDAIRKHLLCHEDELETLCKTCHKRHREN
jgi:5-methylcytosine-specific restriction endonuclease McrA